MELHVYYIQGFYKEICHDIICASVGKCDSFIGDDLPDKVVTYDFVPGLVSGKSDSNLVVAVEGSREGA